MKRFTRSLLLVAALAGIAPATAHADYAYGSYGPPGGYYSCWRPWWGGLSGWGPYHGCSGYPAYKCAATSGYRHRPCLFPPSSYYYGYPGYQGGYQQYPREFIYNWSRAEGEEQPARPDTREQYDPERQ